MRLRTAAESVPEEKYKSELNAARGIFGGQQRSFDCHSKNGTGTGL